MAAGREDERRQALFLECLAARPRVLRFCHSRLGCERDAEDACQETYAELWRKIDDLLDHEMPLGWLFRTAKYKCHEALRRRRPTVQLSEGRGEGRRDDVLENLISQETARALLDRLSLKLREVAELHLQGYTVTEIAERLGINQNTVSLRLHRIRQFFHLWLNEDGAA